MLTMVVEQCGRDRGGKKLESWTLGKKRGGVLRMESVQKREKERKERD